MISIIYGGITHHYLNSSLSYCNKINNIGTIHNEYVIAMAGNDSAKIGILSGKDSACGDILGPVASFRITESADFMLGGYNTNFEKFRELGMEPVNIAGFTPVIGINLKVNIYDSKLYKINLDNLFSLGIITHGVSVNF